MSQAGEAVYILVVEMVGEVVEVVVEVCQAMVDVLL